VGHPVGLEGVFWHSSVVLDSASVPAHVSGERVRREPGSDGRCGAVRASLAALPSCCRLTQAELAEQAGLSEREVSDLERGLRKHPQRATVRLLIAALAIAPEQAEALELAARRSPSLPQPLAHSPARHNLPTERSSFVGRRDELATLQRLVDPRIVKASPTRLVTLTGAGGCGKTRLAIELARRLVNEFPDGVWFVDLSPIAGCHMSCNPIEADSIEPR
jgi:transcriptional regulator with XRE-family HTH domain